MGNEPPLAFVEPQGLSRGWTNKIWIERPAQAPAAATQRPSGCRVLTGLQGAFGPYTHCDLTVLTASVEPVQREKRSPPRES